MPKRDKNLCKILQIINSVRIMLIISTSRSNSGFLCLLSLSFLIIVSYASGQVDNVKSNRQQQPQQQQNNNYKVNSININNKNVLPIGLTQEASTAQSDNLVLRQKHTNLNKKYEMQSAVTSSPTTSYIFPSKKSE